MAAQGTAIISICHAKIVSICVVSAIFNRVIESLTSFTCDRHSFSCLLNGTVSGGRGDRCDSRVNTPDILGLRSYAVINLKERERMSSSRKINNKGYVSGNCKSAPPKLYAFSSHFAHLDIFYGCRLVSQLEGWSSPIHSLG